MADGHLPVLDLGEMEVLPIILILINVTIIIVVLSSVWKSRTMLDRGESEVKAIGDSDESLGGREEMMRRRRRRRRRWKGEEWRMFSSLPNLDPDNSNCSNICLLLKVKVNYNKIFCGWGILSCGEILSWGEILSCGEILSWGEHLSCGAEGGALSRPAFHF